MYQNIEVGSRAVLYRAPDSYRYKWRGGILIGEKSADGINVQRWFDCPDGGRKLHSTQSTTLSTD
ncbi:uncharacterized protein BN903_151 [Halorubrum sp. AJ67]|nr:uncharacterized protein BN903_151 [Halorubrum sp. AJ67]